MCLSRARSCSWNTFRPLDEELTSCELNLILPSASVRAFFYPGRQTEKKQDLYYPFPTVIKIFRGVCGQKNTTYHSCHVQTWYRVQRRILILTLNLYGSRSVTNSFQGSVKRTETSLYDSNFQVEIRLFFFTFEEC